MAQEGLTVLIYIIKINVFIRKNVDRIERLAVFTRCNTDLILWYISE